MNTSKPNIRATILSANAVKNFIKGTVLIILFVVTQSVFSQVGIGNTDPKATLDITITDPNSPLNTDGILVPRVNTLTFTGLTTDQNGMLVYLTTDVTISTILYPKGFYYWDGIANWISLSKLDDSDWHIQGSASTPTNINDNIYTQGTVAIGSTSSSASKFRVLNDSDISTVNLYTDSDVDNRNGILNYMNGDGTGRRGIYNLLAGNDTQPGIHYNHAIMNDNTMIGDARNIAIRNNFSNAQAYSMTGISNFFASTTNATNSITGLQNSISANSPVVFGVTNSMTGDYSSAVGISNTNYSMPASPGSGDFVGVRTAFINNTASDYLKGTLIELSGSSSGDKIGLEVSIPTSSNGTHYGVYSDVRNPNGYAGYFLGRTSLGIGMTGRYVMPETSGTVNQVMAIDGTGQVDFVDASTIFTGTDNQNITGSGLSGTNLTIGIQNGTSQVVDLSTLQDGTGTDDQTIDNFSFNPSTNELTLEIDNDGIPAQTVDLSSLSASDTDWFEQGTSTLPNSINDDIYTLGGVKIGYTNGTSNDTKLGINSTNETAGVLLFNDVLNTITTPKYGIYVQTDILNGSSGNYQGFTSSISTSNPVSGFITNYRATNNVSSLNTSNDNHYLFYGEFNNNSGGSPSAIRIGSFITFSSNVTNTGNKYGHYTVIPSSVPGQHYGNYSDVEGANNYAAYFIGRTSLGIGTTNRYLMPEADGTINQIMATDGSGQVNFVDVSSLVSGNTLDQAYDQGSAGAGRTIIANDGAVTIGGEDGLLVTGTFGSGDDILISGAGTRLFFNPKKAAFRAGHANWTQWDNANIGQYSVAFGHNSTASEIYSTAMGRNTLASGENSISMGEDTEASGENSTAMGFLTLASGHLSTAVGRSTIASGDFSTAFGYATEASASVSTAMGWNTIASGNYSTAFGTDTTASGSASVAFGFETVASGDNSTAMGNNTDASGTSSTAIGHNTESPSFAETSLGYFNRTYTPSNIASAVDSDRVFSIGNGTNASRSNALTIYKSGLMNINDEYDMPLTDGIVGQVMTTNGSGTVSFQDAAKNTLDQAYDEGGAGAGRTINVDNGAVVIQGNAGGATATTSSQLILTETGANDYSRLRLTNSAETNNIWTIATRTDDTDALSRMNFNHTGIGDLFQLWGDGFVEVNGTLEVDGQVGINVNNPTYALDVRQNVAADYVAQIRNTNTGNDADGLRIQLDSATPGGTNNFIGFLNNTGVFRGRIHGNVTGVTYLTTSDQRLKTDINDIENALSLINKIQPRLYEYKENLGTKEYGFIAQELQPLYPQAVSGSPNSDVTKNPMMVDYGRLTPILTAGIKELKAEVDALKTENATLKAKLNQLESLEARILVLENKTETTLANEVASKED